jgi:uncharacterized membrane protein
LQNSDIAVDSNHTLQVQAVELTDDQAEAKEEHARLTTLRREIQALKLRRQRRKQGKRDKTTGGGER